MMLSRLPITALANPLVQQFLKTLRAHHFQGEIHTDESTRLINATDNSAYQILPETVLIPKETTDIQRIFQLANQPAFHPLTFTARGGGTGTNGQALTAGLVIDCSKYLNRILELNLQEGWVRVEPGVVLDQLNDYLRPQGVFFAPSLSPSNRATLGGMANTDACGKGSIKYGKTSQHVISMTCVYADGNIHTSESIDHAMLEHYKNQSNLIGSIYRQVDDTVCRCHEKIQTQFPRLTRFMTGYDLAHVYSDDRSRFNLNAILTGSEGTLAIVTELKLKLTPIPKHKRLLVLQYTDFNQGLKDAKHLIPFHPTAIETIDQTVLTLAKTDLIYPVVKPYITTPDEVTGSINLVEFCGESLEVIEQTLHALLQTIDQSHCIAYQVINDPLLMRQLWALREKSVGLLGKVEGRRKPTSGLEDTVVPPEKLADFVKEFRTLLDAHELYYGMFGHVDAGCLHVRPALDFTNPQDVALYHTLSDQVAELTHRYGGLMWGEHGKGYRSQYVPMFFGTELYQELRKIKQAFDPYNQLNPGKIATPIDSTASVVQVTAKKRGDFDKQIHPMLAITYANAMHCNGNGACFNYALDDMMCPSYKVTRDRRHSPKGRATLIREWLRFQSLVKPPQFSFRWLNTWFKRKDFSHEVYEAMQGCLGCKACATQCPVNVNVPEVKSIFLKSYYSRYLRPLRDYFIARSEIMAHRQHHWPKVWNKLSTLSEPLLRRLFKLTDVPTLSSPNLPSLCRQHHIEIISINQLEKTPHDPKHIILIQDWLTSYYEAEVVIDCYRLLEKLGFKPLLLEWFPNGKPLHVIGQLTRFKSLAQTNMHLLNRIAMLNIPMVGIDPSITLTYRQEYVKAVDDVDFTVYLLQEWLAEQPLPVINQPSTKAPNFFPHCTEKTAYIESATQWKTLFSRLGLTLTLVNTGCCGMAGSYGHEIEHVNYSKQLFEMSWAPSIPSGNTSLLASGFSCRHQITRCSKVKPLHPVSYLLKCLP